MAATESPPTQPQSPQTVWQKYVLLHALAALLVLVFAVWVLSQVLVREPTTLPALETGNSATSLQTAPWNSLVWEKALWPEQAVAAAPQRAAVKRPATNLIAIVQQGDDIKAAIDAGDGMYFLRIGDTHKQMTLLAIETDKIEMEFQGQRFFLELP